jgi:hypothetical protein
MNAKRSSPRTTDSDSHSGSNSATDHHCRRPLQQHPLIAIIQQAGKFGRKRRERGECTTEPGSNTEPEVFVNRSRCGNSDNDSENK